MSDHVWKITPPMSRKSTFTDDPEEVAFIRKSDGYTITEYRATPTPPVEPVKEADVSAIRDAALEYAHDVLHNCRAMLPENDGAHAEIGKAMEGLRALRGRAG